MSQFKEIYNNVSYATIKDNNVKGVATVYVTEVKIGDKVNNGTRFIEIIED